MYPHDDHMGQIRDCITILGVATAIQTRNQIQVLKLSLEKIMILFFLSHKDDDFKGRSRVSKSKS